MLSRTAHEGSGHRCGAHLQRHLATRSVVCTAMGMGYRRPVRSGMKSQIQEDLEQECYIKLWEELADDGPTFLLENFTFAFGRLRRHVAHDMMEQAGEWQRRGVERPTRIPRSEMDSLHGGART